ncbi:MAG: N-acetylmuramoyl-L-alanine amidase [Desulfobulbaceae bacterium]
MTRLALPPPLFLIILLLSLLTGAASLSAQDLMTNGDSSNPASPEYLKAKDYYYLLVRDEKTQGDRKNWLNGIKDFRQIYQKDPKGELAPNCLFMMAKMYYRMFMRFKDPKDLESSLANYREIWTGFPENTLADDALFWSGEILLKDKKDPVQAAKLYTTQVERFPKGDKYVEAVSRLRDLDAKHKTGLPAALQGKNAYASLVKVLPVKYWSSDEYSRIVIRASGPVRYNSTLADRQEGKPRRLDIDFVQSTIEARYTAPVAIRDGLLQQLHSSQYNPTTVRVSLDIEGISTYKIFSLNDPFRVIVDIHGPQSIIATPKTLPDFQQERIDVAVQAKPAPAHPPQPVPSDKGSALDKESVASAPAESEVVILDDRKKRKPGTAGGGSGFRLAGGLSLAQQLGLGVRRIVIDPGHGGKDPGAMANNLKEKDITLLVAKKTAEILQETYNYEVILTRTKDVTLPLEERTALANTSKADLFISIHVNSHPRPATSGVETFFLNLATNNEAMRVAALENATSSHNISDLQDILSDLMQNSKIQESSILAEYVQKKLSAGLGSRYATKDLGVKQAPFYVLIGAEMPAVLAEVSFISNKKEAERLRQDEYLSEIASQIAAGVAGYTEHQATAGLQL